MSEVNPFDYQEGDPTFKVDFLDGELYLHRKNTFIYEYSKQIEGDHIFIANDLKEGEVMGSYMFRKRLEEAGVEMSWNKLVTDLGSIGCNLFQLKYMDEADQAIYERHFGEKPERKPKKEKLFELNPHQDSMVHYLGYLLEENIIQPPDFDKRFLI